MQRFQMARSAKFRVETRSATSEAWNSNDWVSSGCFGAGGPLGRAEETATKSLGRRVARAEYASVVSLTMSRWGGGGPDDEAPDFSKVLSAASPKARTWCYDMSICQLSPERLGELTSGKAAPLAILETPSTNGLRYLAATLGSRTSFTRLSITTTVRR